MIIFNCAVNEYPSKKALDYPKILTPTFFPLSPPTPTGTKFGEIQIKTFIYLNFDIIVAQEEFGVKHG